jgi:hypothetical protein
MAETNKTSDVTKLLRETRDGVMDAWAKFMLRLTSSHEYQRLQGTIMKPTLIGYALARKASEAVMGPFLSYLNMPTREEVISIAQRLTHVEIALDDLGAAIEQIRRATVARPPRGQTSREREGNGSAVAKEV